ncbi:hypothetical protein CER89_23325 [Salmonella enterica subsp. enterica serovar Anatum]|nr:hypothetical protein [Salmonella enterica subsp. enterica serovar Anatum]
MLRIEPVPVSPRLRGQRPLTPPAFGLRAPLGLRPSASALRLASGLRPPRWRLAAGVSRQPGSPVSQLPGHKAVPLAWVVPPMTAVKPGAAGCQQTLRSSC